MRHTRPSCSPAAQTAPAPTAMPRSALAPTRIVCPTRFVRGSMRLTASLSRSRTTRRRRRRRSCSPPPGPSRPRARCEGRAARSSRRVDGPHAAVPDRDSRVAAVGQPFLGTSVQAGRVGHGRGAGVDARDRHRGVDGRAAAPADPDRPGSAAMSLGMPRSRSAAPPRAWRGRSSSRSAPRSFSAQIAPSPTATLLGGEGVSVSDANRPSSPSNEAIPLAFDGAGVVRVAARRDRGDRDRRGGDDAPDRDGAPDAPGSPVLAGCAPSQRAPRGGDELRAGRVATVALLREPAPQDVVDAGMPIGGGVSCR